MDHGRSWRLSRMAVKGRCIMQIAVFFSSRATILLAVKYITWIFHASIRKMTWILRYSWILKNILRAAKNTYDFVFIGFLPLSFFKNQINLMTFRGQVTIFNPHDYPDMTSGGVIDFLVSPMKHRSVELEAIVFYSTRNIIPYPLEKRDCVFQDEMTSFNMFYTYSDCIVDCKIDEIWNTCKCVPFFLPNRSKNRQWFYQS